jgi:hypothetical protein
LEDFTSERVADNPEAPEMCVRMHQETEAELASMPAINRETAAALEQFRLQDEEVVRQERARELSVDAGVELKLALLHGTPRHVLMADIQLMRTIREGLATPVSEPPSA